MLILHVPSAANARGPKHSIGCRTLRTCNGTSGSIGQRLHWEHKKRQRSHISEGTPALQVLRAAHMHLHPGLHGSTTTITTTNHTLDARQ